MRIHKKTDTINMNELSSIVFSKIKIIRNISKYPFINSISNEKKRKLEKEIIDYVSTFKIKKNVYDIENLDENDKKIFLDENIVGKSFINEKNGKFIYFPDKHTTITLNFMDHLNISTVIPNLNIEKGYKDISEIEDKIGKKFRYAASTKYGFLTTRIKDCGLGIKIFVMVHLPGLVYQNKYEKIFEKYNERGYKIIPWYNNKENKETEYFIVSTSLNFGVNENDLIERFHSGILDLLNYEKKALKMYFLKNKDELVDKIYRSMGLLRYSKQMNFDEMFEHLSNIRLGLSLDLKLDISIKNINKLFRLIKNGYVDKFSKENGVNKEYAICEIVKSNINLEIKDVS